MRQMLKKFLTLIMVLILCAIPSLTVSALSKSEPYDSYFYDEQGKSYVAPISFVPTNCLNKFSDGSLIADITDMYADTNGTLYLLHSKQSKIVLLDKNLNYLKEISINDNGNKIEFVGAKGLYVHETAQGIKIYVADCENRRILKADENGKLLNVFTKPDADIFSKEEDFIPEKIIVNDSNTIFALCKGIYKGAVVFNDNGEFLGFYGSNRVKVNAQLLYDYAWKSFFGAERTKSMKTYVPIEFTNFDIDEKGFIYTITSSDKADKNISYINYKGINLLDSEFSFGDIENLDNNNEEMPTAFVDIVNMGGGIFAALDLTRGRVFIYEKNGHNLMVFGNIGSSSGMFSQVGAIECIEDNIYVYDAANKDITVFSPNLYGKNVLNATRQFLDGKYDESIEIWNSVLESNQSFSLAYLSIGRALSGKNDYIGAMKYFEKANSKTDYSEAFAEQRKIFLTEWLWLILVGIIAIVMVLVVVSVIYKKKTLQKEKNPTVFTLLSHPKRDMLYIIREKPKTGLISIIIVAVWFLLEVVSVNTTGFIFSTAKENPLNLGIVFASTFGLVLLFVLVNFLITAIFNGNGTFFEIFKVVAVALIPYIITRFIRLIMTNFCTLGEQSFITIVITIGLLWSLLILLIGLSQIHEFSALGTVGCFLFTVLGMALVVFLLLLVSSVVAQIVQFVKDIWSEFLCIIS